MCRRVRAAAPLWRAPCATTGPPRGRPRVSSMPCYRIAPCPTQVSTSVACAAAPRWRCAIPHPTVHGRPINSGCARGAAVTSGRPTRPRNPLKQNPQRRNRRSSHPRRMTADARVFTLLYKLQEEPDDDPDDDDFDDEDEDEDVDEESDEEEPETWQVSTTQRFR